MPRYIDADPLYQKINDWRKQIKTTCGERDDYVECLGEVLTFIGSEPNADVVEVVRCKDCRFECGDACLHALGLAAIESPKCYCAYGSRKEKADAEIH